MPADAWTMQDAPRQDGKIAVVTGANAGLGREISRALAGLGVHVVLACRNEVSARAAVDGITATTPGASLQVLRLDLASLESVRAFADEVVTEYNSIDLLINNAGVMAGKPSTTADGLELDFGTNFVGHFVLTARLMPALQAAAGRVVTVGSQAHRVGEIDFDDLPMARGFTPAKAYGRAKLAQLIFAVELQRRLAAAQSPAISLAAHPGSTRTGVMREQTPFLRWAYQTPKLRFITDRFITDVDKGAESIVRAAVDPGVLGGQYYGPSGFLGFVGPAALTLPNAKALDAVVGARLWAAAQRLSGVDFNVGAPR